MEDNLFQGSPNIYEPLASRMRPRTLDEFIGQEDILSKDKLLYKAIKADKISSLIFWGPPGVGKTTLAQVIANTTSSYFVSVSAIFCGTAELKKILDKAIDDKRYHSKKTVLFVDEIHRWNKSQQDCLLPNVEKGDIILIGATSENPYREINRALLSRSRVFELKKLNSSSLKKIAQNAINDKEKGLGGKNIKISSQALDYLCSSSLGDARNLLNALEWASLATKEDKNGAINITIDIIKESIQNNTINYDKNYDEHYDVASAFIKSMRGSDPDATLYYLAKMILGGEDPHFIFRRMLILACEDVGLANPDAISVVNSCAAAFDYVGFPEGKYHLAFSALYLATSPKSSSVNCYFKAEDFVKDNGSLEIPNYLKDKTSPNHTNDYKYPHNYKNHWVKQQYLPFGVREKFFDFGDIGYEAKLKKFFENYLK